MSHRLTALALGALIGTAAFTATPAAAQNRVKVGVLSCNVSPGIGLLVISQREVGCVFRANGRRGREAYAGRITRVGLDIGITGRGILAWEVFADTRRLSRSQLAGSYAGASAAASLGVGLGANALVGGSRNTIALQPLSVEAQIGVNLALGVANLRLTRTR
ncbi:DUF992 domain-containing protein [Phreatobacter aquaticus]|uniref:DUF992 domain-containing protein n=1 Tax=Phreatobacter aquaticus TaxID=2570229 RepID=A0A4D7QHQ0_9HYPH|nr:DUF992 domain-containing protein [Phreatobacter aquaticus]QCK85349.1 DUF992 domain-containing protein [Phreatobacter aquaticus]